MKVVLVLKYPNVDVIADIEDDVLESYETGDYPNFNPSFQNVHVVQWIDKYVTMIPFKAAKNLSVNIPFDNIAMMFEADEKLAQIHEEEKKKVVTAFVSKDEFEEMIKRNQEKVNKTLGK